MLNGSLAGVDEDLINFGLDEHVVRVSDIQRANCNWKLVIDAFSEGYHLKSLHYTFLHGVSQHSAGVSPRLDLPHHCLSRRHRPEHYLPRYAGASLGRHAG